jgi:hypothetical protein
LVLIREILTLEEIPHWTLVSHLKMESASQALTAGPKPKRKDRNASEAGNYDWLSNPATENLLSHAVIKWGCSWKNIWDTYFGSVKYPRLSPDKLKNHWYQMQRGKHYILSELTIFRWEG